MVSLTLSALSVGWAVLSHHLVGSRVKMSLSRGIVTHRDAWATSHNATWTSDRMPAQMMLEQGLWEDVAVIEIANVGRAPLTVSNIGISIKTEKRGFGRNRTGSHDWTLIGLELKECLGPQEANTRLQAGEATRLVIPMYETNQWLQDQLQKQVRLSIRSICTVPLNRRRRSSWRKRWKITSSQLGTFRYAPTTSDTELYRLLLAHVPDRRPSSAYQAFLEVRPVADQGVSAIAEALRPTLGLNGFKLGLTIKQMGLGPWPESNESPKGQ